MPTRENDQTTIALHEQRQREFSSYVPRQRPPLPLLSFKTRGFALLVGCEGLQAKPVVPQQAKRDTGAPASPRRQPSSPPTARGQWVNDWTTEWVGGVKGRSGGPCKGILPSPSAAFLSLLPVMRARLATIPTSKLRADDDRRHHSSVVWNVRGENFVDIRMYTSLTS
ncbi:hypothetical protein GALMADRAFT_1249611 [Galerina marginata CBS 339.88]|uniref:Uncharacterized protein n=1 Tax=Galerina marginata (strain CBS 339.88) TaxID=685588 RepID=A0A067T7Y7_GALM3|nr:hypothetical protein GALMADRAFT_1249611 [Galerina marginata CBS 339.88]